MARWNASEGASERMFFILKLCNQWLPWKSVLIYLDEVASIISTCADDIKIDGIVDSEEGIYVYNRI